MTNARPYLAKSGASVWAPCPTAGCEHCSVVGCPSRIHFMHYASENLPRHAPYFNLSVRPDLRQDHTGTSATEAQ